MSSGLDLVYYEPLLFQHLDISLEHPVTPARSITFPLTIVIIRQALVDFLARAFIGHQNPEQVKDAPQRLALLTVSAAACVHYFFSLYMGQSNTNQCHENAQSTNK